MTCRSRFDLTDSIYDILYIYCKLNKRLQFGAYSQRCQMAVVTATFQKCFTSWMSVKIGGREPYSQTPTYDTPATARKASNSRDVGNSKDPSSNGNDS